MTDAMGVIRRLHQHRDWVNQNLLESARALNDEQLRKAFEIGQGSVWKSMVHMYAAEYVWLEALLGHEDPLVQGDLPGHLPGNQLGQGTIASLNELSGLWCKLEGRWSQFLTTINPESLEQVVYKISSNSALGRFGTKQLDILLHVCTHAHYTAAQVINMLRQCGVQKFPGTMVVMMARQEAQTSPSSG